MQAITTHFIGATNTKPARIKAATATGLSHVVGFHTYGGERESTAACVTALLDKMGWGGRWVGGSTKAGWVFVCVTPRRSTRRAVVVMP